MKKGYTVKFGIRYYFDVELETEEEDQKKIELEAARMYIKELRESGEVFQMFDMCGPVKFERNYSEQPEKALKIEEGLKDYKVTFYCRETNLVVTIKAVDQGDAIEKAEEQMSTQFTSEDGMTDCEVWKYNFEGVELADWEKED